MNSKADYFEQKPLIRNLLTEYRKYGGFPEVVLREEPEDKEGSFTVTGEKDPLIVQGHAYCFLKK